MNKSIYSKAILSLIFTIFLASKSGAHGEDKYGPHKGFVRMPGAFHTELLLNGKNKLKVYLLDIDWKNPTVEKSSLEITYNDQLKADCKPQKNFYLCKFDKSVNLKKKGELKVNSSRNEQKGMEVIYNLPLKLEASKDVKDTNDANDAHSGH